VQAFLAIHKALLAGLAWEEGRLVGEVEPAAAAITVERRLS
jgi:hypothetical protein